MNEPVTLTLEQQFNVRSFETQVRQLSREQAQKMLVSMYEQMLARDVMYRQMIAKRWGIEPPAKP